MVAVAGLRGTGDWGTDERPKNFRERILFLDPNSDSPVFALTGKAGKYSVDDPQYFWWCETNNIVRFQIATGNGMSSTDVVMATTTPDPTAANLGIPYGSPVHLKPGDVLLVEPATLSTYTPEFCMVTQVIDPSHVQVLRAMAGTTAAAIPAGTNILLVNSAYAEGTNAPLAVSRNPVKFTNYCQIFKDTYELTKTADRTRARTGDAWTNDKKRKMFDHARAIEHTLLYQYTAQETTGPNGKPLRFTAGLRNFIPTTNTRAFTAACTTDDILTALEPIWAFTLPGTGDTRIGFTGNIGLLEMGKIIRNDDSVMMQIGEKVTLWGIDFRELIVPWGRLLLKGHPLLSRSTLFRKSLYILDFSALKWAPLNGRDTKPYDDVQLPDEDIRRGYVMTEGGWFVDGGGLTMGILDNISSV